VRKEVPVEIVYETENIMIFKDIHPKTPVHLLAIPKKHIQSVIHVEDKDLPLILDIWKGINKVVENFQIKDKGFRIVVNTGKEGKQAVLHLHFHILGGQQLP
jgi:histidine triad (HIT) family protein